MTIKPITFRVDGCYGQPFAFGGEVTFLPAAKDFEDHPRPRVLECPFDYAENSRGLGPAEMAAAIRAGRPNRASARMACHVLEVIDALLEDGRFVDIHSTCERPEPLNGVSLD